MGHAASLYGGREPSFRRQRLRATGGVSGDRALNYLFAGSPRAGRGAAILYSLVGGAKANGVEPFAWLEAFFTELRCHRTREAFAQVADKKPDTSLELDHMLPGQWLKAHSIHVWTIDQVRRADDGPSDARCRSPCANCTLWWESA